MTGADLPDTPTIQLWELACLRLAISIDTTLQRSTATTISITTLAERRLELLGNPAGRPLDGRCLTNGYERALIQHSCRLAGRLRRQASSHILTAVHQLDKRGCQAAVGWVQPCIKKPRLHHCRRGFL